MTNDFVEYVLMFYGKGGLYELRNEEGKPLTAKAAHNLLPFLHYAMKEQDWSWGGGDTMDREFFREEVLEHAGYTEHTTKGEKK